MKPNWLPTGLLSALLAGSAAADVVVDFRNEVLTATYVKVVFGDNLDGFTVGSPVVNRDSPGNKTFAAQLFQEVDGALTPVGAPANFRSVSYDDPLAGTWSGANRTIVGLPADATVLLRVRAWDASFPSYEVAAAVGGITGISASFTFRNVLSNPPATTDAYMVNFTGFQIGIPIPEPSSVFLSVMGLTSLLLLHRTPVKEKPSGSDRGWKPLRDCDPQ